MTESGITKVQLALKLAKTVHFKKLSKTALQFILQHIVNLNIDSVSEVVQVLHHIESLALKPEGGQINVGHLHFIFNYCFIIVTVRIAGCVMMCYFTFIDVLMTVNGPSSVVQAHDSGILPALLKSGPSLTQPGCTPS